MGWMDSIKSMGQYQQEGYDAELQNQLRQAQAAQLVQEALRSQAMMPYDIRSKIADVDFKEAQAEQMRRSSKIDNEQRYADKIAKADQMKRLSQGRDTRSV